MIKGDLINAVSARSKLSRSRTLVAVETVLGVIKEALQRGEQVRIVGFGRFAVRQKQARVGRNPRTGRVIPIAPRKVLTFKPSKGFCRKFSVPVW
jgi:integration host factor subunit alpha